MEKEDKPYGRRQKTDQLQEAISLSISINDQISQSGLDLLLNSAAFIDTYGQILAGKMSLLFLVIGIIPVISSFFINEFIISVISVIFRFICFWGIYEKKVKK